MQTGVFSLVANGDLSRFAHETDPVLFAYRYLIGPPQNCSEGLDREVLHAAMKQRYDELVSGIGMVDKQRLVADPTACYRYLLRSFANQDGPKLQDGIWVDAGGTHALMLAIIAENALDLTAQGEAVSTIEAVFADLTECQGLTLELAGPGYFAVASERQIKTETMVLSIIASFLVALILALAFRSSSLVFLGLLPLASGILVGIVLVSSIFGFVHGITLGLGVTLLGVALDYPVHVYSHAQGSTNGRGLVIWSTLMLCMVSTALGYAALAWTNFDGLSQLGILTAIGLGVAALTSLYLLPPLLPKGYSLPEHSWLSSIQHRLPCMSPAAGIIVFLLLLVGLTVMLTGRDSPWETDIRRLSTVPQREIEKDAEIRAELGAPDVSRLLYLVGKDQVEVLKRLEVVTPDLEGLQQRGLIGGFDSAALWLPSP
jgi:predicted exporter